MRYSRLQHSFVRHIPEEITPGILYVSLEYCTAIHRCCCGCGEEVVTPFSPTDWQMVFDGESISLSPSVGNWNSRCRSHYVIRRGRVIEAGSWSQSQVIKGRQNNKEAKKRYYGNLIEASSPQGQQDNFLSRIKRWWSN